MRGKPLLPFAITAVLGIGLIIILSFVGLHQGGEVAEEGGDGNEFESTYELGEHVYVGTCAGCHGGDLGGVGSNPALNALEGKLSEDEIATIVKEGRGAMPGFGHLSNDEVNAVIEFLFTESE